MNVHRVVADPALFGQTELLRRMERLSVRLSSGQQLALAGEDPLRWGEGAAARERVRQLDAVRERLQSAAVTFRAIRHAVDALDQFMEMLRREAEAIRDNPADTAARTSHAARYNELLRQMNAVVNGLRDETARELTGDPAVVSGAGDREIVAENGRRLAVRGRRLDTGPGGLDIPALADTPTLPDAQAALSNLAAAGERLKERSAGFSQEEVEAVRLLESNTSIRGSLVSRAERLEAADLEETSAVLESLSVQQSLLLNSVKVSHELQAVLLEVLA